MIPKMHKPSAVMLMSCLAFAASGCASLDFFKFGKEDFPTADAKNPVVQVVAMWQPATGVGLDGKSCRGFAGQILFMTRDSAVPAKVNGKVDIYVFDDQGKGDELAKPLHHFIFEDDGWNVQARISKLGLTYSVFIPYTRPGSQEAQCSLRVGFTPKAGQGHTVSSDMCNVDLPGVSKNKKKKASDLDDDDLVGDDEYVSKAVKAAKELGGNRITQASYEEPAGPRGNRQAIDELAAEAFREANAKASTAPRTLPPDEEQRIIREMQAQMGDSLKVTREPRAASTKSNRPRGRNPLMDVPLTRDEDDEDDGVVYQRTARRPVSRKTHVLNDGPEAGEDDSDIDEEDVAPVSARKKGSGTKAVRSGRHPLEGNDTPETTRRGRKWGEVLTINLSELE